MMKSRLIFLLVLFLIHLSSLAQLNKRKLGEKAFEYYIDDKFDTASVLYERLIATKKYRQDSYLFKQLGNCYFHLNQFEKSKNSYLQCLSDTVIVPYSPQRECCLGLADLYIQANNHEKALEYLQLAETKYPHFKICSTGEFERKISLSYKFSKCFEAIGKIDTAISYLTSYMFADAKYIDLGKSDSSEYLNIINYYVELLNKKYTAGEIKSELTRAIETIYYKKEREKSTVDDPADWELYNVECYFIFFWEKVYLTNSTYEANSWGGEPVLAFTKEYLIEKLAKTPAYKMLGK